MAKVSAAKVSAALAPGLGSRFRETTNHSHAPRPCTHKSNAEVLALDWRDFKDLLDASDPTARDFMRIVEQRRAALPA
jgi:hypothetical protein